MAKNPIQSIHSFSVYITIVDINSEYFTFFLKRTIYVNLKPQLNRSKHVSGSCEDEAKISCLVAVNKSCAYDLQAKSRSMVRV